jgi:hypothetical protein
MILKRLKPETAFKTTEVIFRVAKPFYKISKNRVYRKVLNIVFPIVYFENEIPELKEKLKE